mmetsp:Transcript_14083/g.29150  ORF Transcript_14083/g.29150 Transcript_14083/m.29150 type:complete len:89 (+) Transcript_14083:2421-2687(+)
MQSDDDIENTTDNIHIFQSIARPIVCYDILTSHRPSLQSNQCDNDIIYDDKHQYILQTFRYRDLSSFEEDERFRYRQVGRGKSRNLNS